MDHSAIVTILNIPPALSEELLTHALGPYGASARVKVNPEKKHAILRYDNAFADPDQAKSILNKLESHELKLESQIGRLRLNGIKTSNPKKTEFFFSFYLPEVDHATTNVTGSTINDQDHGVRHIEVENDLPTTSQKWPAIVVFIINVGIFVFVGLTMAAIVEYEEGGGLGWARVFASFSAATYAIGWLISSSAYTHIIRFVACIASMSLLFVMYLDVFVPSFWLSLAICVGLTGICCRAFIYKCRKFQIELSYSTSDISDSTKKTREWLIGAWVFSGSLLVLSYAPPFYFLSPLRSIKPVQIFLDLRFLSTEVAVLVLLVGAGKELVNDHLALVTIKRDIFGEVYLDSFWGRFFGGLRVLFNVPVWIGRFIKLLFLKCFDIVRQKWFLKYIWKAIGRVGSSLIIFYALLLASGWLGFLIVGSFDASSNMTLGESFTVLAKVAPACCIITSLMSWLGYIWLKQWTLNALIEKATLALTGFCLADLILVGLHKFGFPVGASFSQPGLFFWAVLVVVLLGLLAGHLLDNRKQNHA